jgi:hypothetical protein
VVLQRENEYLRIETTHDPSGAFTLILHRADGTQRFRDV